MSTHQQAVFMDTIVAVKKALKRKAYDSDSDSSIEHNTNRGSKLKKRARFVQRDRLAGSAGPAIYKEVVELAGFRRAIISANKPLIDEDGYDVDSGDDDERAHEAIATAAEENPYSSIRLEQILAPLTSITDLPTHPTLSRPFTSKALTELANQGSALMHKEKEALWKVKPLLTRLCGDHTWAPCGMFTSPNDEELFSDELTMRLLGFHPQALQLTGATTPTVNGELGKKRIALIANGDGNGISSQPAQAPETDVAAAVLAPSDAIVNGVADNTLVRDPSRKDSSPRSNGDQPEPSDGGIDEPKEHDKLVRKEERHGGDVHKANKDKTQEQEEGAIQREQPPEQLALQRLPDVDGKMDASMTDSGIGGSRPDSATPDPLDQLFIHPLFLAPASARPDRNIGLPEQEAEDVRRLVQLYVQKQEEVCRGTTRLYEGLRRADRLRKTVLKWAKAEAHCGAHRDMSDWEDWYDKEEWGLTEDLKKGQDEEEEDAAQTQKKTRNRR